MTIYCTSTRSILRYRIHSQPHSYSQKENIIIGATGSSGSLVDCCPKLMNKQQQQQQQQHGNPFLLFLVPMKFFHHQRKRFQHHQQQQYQKVFLLFSNILIGFTLLLLLLLSLSSLSSSNMNHQCFQKVVGGGGGRCGGSGSGFAVHALQTSQQQYRRIVLPTMFVPTTIQRITTHNHQNNIRRTTTSTTTFLLKNSNILNNNLRNSFCSSSSSSTSLGVGTSSKTSKDNKGTILILGGTGYLGQYVCLEAIQAGYHVISLSRRGLPSQFNNNNKDNDTTTSSTDSSPFNQRERELLDPQNHYVDYRTGDARKSTTVANILQSISQSQQQSQKLVGVVHCVGLLFDDASGIGSYNKYVSGSGSIPDTDSTYDTITRLTAFNAIDNVLSYIQNQQQEDQSNNNNNNMNPIPFCFTSAAEAGWPQMTGGTLIESIMPEFIQRYMIAKRAVEKKLLDLPSSSPPESSYLLLRPIIFRPSLIYSPKSLASLPSVSFFTIANQIGIPFVDRPVTVQSLSRAIIKSIENPTISGIQRYMDIDQLSK